MHRKYFLSSLIPVAAMLSSVRIKATALTAERTVIKRPPYLKQGDVIGITCPAGNISLEAIQPAVELMKIWGFQIEIGQTVGKRDFTLGGTDEERAADLQKMLDNPKIKAIMCARGGYGAVRIIDRLSFQQFLRSPKWVIGFSDITVLHNHIHRNCRYSTLHSKMCNSFPDKWADAESIQVETILSIKRALMGEPLTYTSPASTFNRSGQAKATLVGGNLSILTNMAGTKSDINTTGKILFIEDTGEYLYNIDRMLFNLKRTGKLDQLAGLIVGGFKAKPDDPGEEFGHTLQSIVLEKVKEFAYPVCFDFPVGHQENNFALKCGCTHTFNVTTTGGSLSAEN